MPTALPAAHFQAVSGESWNEDVPRYQSDFRARGRAETGRTTTRLAKQIRSAGL